MLLPGTILRYYAKRTFLNSDPFRYGNTYNVIPACIYFHLCKDLTFFNKGALMNLPVSFSFVKATPFFLCSKTQSICTLSNSLFSFQLIRSSHRMNACSIIPSVSFHLHLQFPLAVASSKFLSTNVIASIFLHSNALSLPSCFSNHWEILPKKFPLLPPSSPSRGLFFSSSATLISISRQFSQGRQTKSESYPLSMNIHKSDYSCDGIDESKKETCRHKKENEIYHEDTKSSFLRCEYETENQKIPNINKNVDANNNTNDKLDGQFDRHFQASTTEEFNAKHREQSEAGSSMDSHRHERHSSWTFSKVVSVFFVGIFSSSYVYLLYKCDFSFGKTELVISDKIKEWIVGSHPIREGILNSKYQVALKPETAREIALYFLQLDLDKPNGVRRSDAIDLIKKIGFSSESGICKNFIQAAKTRQQSSKLSSGCSLQEFGELIEGLVLEETNKQKTEKEVTKDTNTDDIEGTTDIHDMTNGKKAVTKELNGQNHGEDGKKERLIINKDPEERVFEFLVKENKFVERSSVPSVYIPLSAASPFLKPNDQIEGVTAHDFSALPQENHPDEECDLDYLQTMKTYKERSAEELRQLKRRRELSEAENSRYQDIMQEISQLDREMLRLNNNM